MTKILKHGKIDLNSQMAGDDMVKNIIIGKPIVHPKYIFCSEDTE